MPLDALADVDKPLRMPVQWVNRPNQNFRGFSGQIASGTMARERRSGSFHPAGSTVFEQYRDHGRRP